LQSIRLSCPRPPGVPAIARATIAAPPAAKNKQQPPGTLAPLTADDIQAQTDPQSFSRGRGYARGGRIFNPIRRDNVLQTQCHGSSGGPYRVMATLAAADQAKRGALLTVSCDCPRGAFCKHIVALLLTWTASPDTFEVRPPISELMAAKSREELVALLELLLGEDPDLEDRVLTLLALPLPGAGVPSGQLLDEAAIRRQIANALPDHEQYHWDGYRHGYHDNYHGGGVSADLERMVALGDAYIQAGDWRNALRIFATFVEEVAEGSRR